MEFTETLPSYVCTGDGDALPERDTPANFQPIDVVSMEVLYKNGKEDYRNIRSTESRRRSRRRAAPGAQASSARC